MTAAAGAAAGAVSEANWDETGPFVVTDAADGAVTAEEFAAGVWPRGIFGVPAPAGRGDDGIKLSAMRTAPRIRVR